MNEKIQVLRENIKKVIIGKENTIDLLMTALLSKGCGLSQSIRCIYPKIICYLATVFFRWFKMKIIESAFPIKINKSLGQNHCVT